MSPAHDVQRVARFIDGEGAPRYGLLLSGEHPDDAVLQPIDGEPTRLGPPHGDPVAARDLRLLPPCLPSKIVGIGSNYRAHAAEMGRALPTVPKVFLKPPSAVIGPGQPIRIPPGTNRVDHEAELALVIGQHCARVPVDRALDAVLGVTCLDDVTARDFQRADGVFARGKGFDSFCPVGPWISLGLDPRDLGVRCRVWRDGAWVLTQDGRSDDMVFGPAQLIAFVSSIMTLWPGDLIATGTPAGVGPLHAGERVQVQVQGVGILENPVEDRDDRVAAGG